MQVPSTVRDFPGLVKWIITTQHDGVVYGLAKRLGVSPATADKWSRGIVKQPTIQLLTKFCRVYHLDLAEVIRVSSKRIAVLTLAATLGMVPGHLAPHGSSFQADAPASYRRFLRLLLTSFRPLLYQDRATFLGVCA